MNSAWFVIVVPVALVFLGWLTVRGTSTNVAKNRWATARDVRVLARRGPHRLILGRLVGSFGRRPMLSIEARHSVVIFGPTQSGKTTSFALPALNHWKGGVVAASVKSDLLAPTLNSRRRHGPVYVFDPSGVTDTAGCSFDLIDRVGTWTDARRVANALTAGATMAAPSADSEFWYSAATKLLAPLLLASRLANGSLELVAEWLDTQATEEVTNLLETHRCEGALRAAQASWLREDRQRSSVYTTAETIIDPFVTGGSGVGEPLDIEAVVSGSASLYLCAPAHDQRRLRAVFTMIVSTVLETAYERSLTNDAPLDPPLLVILDEAAQLTPLHDLDALAATAAGHGIQLVSIFQDLSQVQARYGARAATVVNNHRAKVFLPGIGDPATLEYLAQMGGETIVTNPPVRATGSYRQPFAPPSYRPLCAPDLMRRMPRGRAVAIYHSLPPIRLALCPAAMSRRPETAGRAPHYARTSWPAKVQRHRSPSRSIWPTLG